MMYLILCFDYAHGTLFCRANGFSPDETYLACREEHIHNMGSCEFNGLIIVPGFYENEFAHGLFNAGIARLRGR